MFKVGDRVKGIKKGVTGFGEVGTIAAPYRPVGNVKWEWLIKFDNQHISSVPEGVAYYSHELEHYVEPDHFMCHVEGQRGPAFVHPNIEAARTEATRLACQQANRGHKVYVLKAVEVVEAAKPVLPEPVVTKL